jgi:ribosomal protein L12E/L44/L45/RPP1/RPP2
MCLSWASKTGTCSGRGLTATARAMPVAEQEDDGEEEEEEEQEEEEEEEEEEDMVCVSTIR